MRWYAGCMLLVWQWMHIERCRNDVELPLGWVTWVPRSESEEIGEDEVLKRNFDVLLLWRLENIG